MQHYHVYRMNGNRLFQSEIAWENLPIPYSITDIGREYLARLRVEEHANEADPPKDGPANILRSVSADDGLARA